MGSEASAIDGVTTRHLTIRIEQPALLPERPDSLPAARRLATAVTRSLTNAQDYEQVVISIEQKQEYGGIASVTKDGTYRCPIQELRN